jgi:hypothetical protein
MPEGRLERAADMSKVTIPPLDTLHHDNAFFHALSQQKAPILNGLLDDLHRYYTRR